MNEHSEQTCSCCSDTMSKINERLTISPQESQAIYQHLSQSLTSTSSLMSETQYWLINAKLFDGETLTIKDNVSLFIDGDKIGQIVVGQEAKIEGYKTLDCQGYTLMPGLIDAHWHSLLCAITKPQAMMEEMTYIHLVAAKEANNTLMRGFTTIRDAGGPCFSLKKAIDQQIFNGPRIYPSGAMISQTSGHADFRMASELFACHSLSRIEREGIASIADGNDAVLKSVREQLMQGASQIKLMAGGGVASPHDHLFTNQYTANELKTAVDAANDWGTYVMVHAYTTQSIQRAIECGVRCIEHGQLCDEETAQLMAECDIWWSLQPFLADEDANVYHDANNINKQRLVSEGTVRAYELAKKYKVKLAWGTDILFTPSNLAKQGKMLSKLTRFFKPLEVLRMATSSNGQLLKLSGPCDPYPGELGVIKEKALADLLLVSGNLNNDISFLEDPENKIAVIIQGGKIKKLTL